jgi:hypothetical protein
MIAMMVVIVIIPIVVGVPAALIFVPPAVAVFPAVRACFAEFVAPVFRFGALPAMVLDGFVKLVVSPGDALLAVVCPDAGGAGKEKRNCNAEWTEGLTKNVHRNPPIYDSHTSGRKCFSVPGLIAKERGAWEGPRQAHWQKRS